ncbi:MAG: PrsW family intramembrane metalloprotease [Leptospirales bacterium]|nr:PrsW family intramembrane metalloprotease [Leptospirales bacterium]
MYLLPLAILPGLILLYYFYKKDHASPEPWYHIWITVILAGIFVLPAAFAEIGLSSLTGLSEVGSAINVFIYSVFVVSLVEELCKLLAIRVFAYRKPEFDETIDGLVYGAASGAGFAMVENVFYVLEHGFAVGVMRAFLSVPLHVFTGVILGYGLIRLKLHGSYLRIVLLFVLSVVLHGVYDHVLFTMNAGSPGISFLIAVCCVVILLGFARYYARKYQTSVEDNSPKPSVFMKFFWMIAGILNLLASAFMALGTYANYSEGKLDDPGIYATLILLPLALGVFCLMRQRRYTWS